MTNEITAHEWEALSAYLDKELPPKDATRLEARLRAQPELRGALEDLRKTRTILRSQPKMRAPRNFTLTPEMVGRRKTDLGFLRELFPVMRFTSAMASVLLVLVLISDIFSSVPLGGSQVAQAPAGMSYEEAAGSALPGETSEGFAGDTSQKGAEDSARQMAQGETTEEAELLMAPAATEEAALAMEAPAEASPESEEPAARSAPDQETAEELQSTQAMAASEIADNAAMAEPSSAGGQSTFSEPAPAEAPAPLQPNREILRVFEWILGALAVLSGLGAFILRKTGKTRAS